jgi:hypothetical protein
MAFLYPGYVPGCMNLFRVLPGLQPSPHQFFIEILLKAITASGIPIHIIKINIPMIELTRLNEPVFTFDNGRTMRFITTQVKTPYNTPVHILKCMRAGKFSQTQKNSNVKINAIT